MAKDNDHILLVAGTEIFLGDGLERFRKTIETIAPDCLKGVTLKTVSYDWTMALIAEVEDDGTDVSSKVAQLRMFAKKASKGMNNLVG